MNIPDLKRKLATEQTLLNQYEEQAEYATDPRKQQEIEAKIEDAQFKIAGIKAMLAQLGVAEDELDDPDKHDNNIPSTLPPQPYFFGRQKELGLIAEAISPQARTWGALIDGPGGIGKTALAIRSGHLAPAADFDRKIFLSAKVRELTPKGEQALEDFMLPNYMELLAELAHELGDETLAKLPPNERANAVRRALADARALIVIDNVETFEESERARLYQFLSRLPLSCKAIVTSRRRTDIDARAVRLDRLEREEALQLMAELAKNNRHLRRATMPEREDLYAITNGNPLLIRWLVGQLGRQGSQCHTIAQACTYLEKAPPDNDPLEYIFGDLLDTFTEGETSVLTALVHFREPAKVAWVAAVADMAEPAARTALEDLADRALLVADAALERFFLPPLAATFLRCTHPEAVGQTATRLTDRAFALVLENGCDAYDRFPTLAAEWPTIAAALPLWLQAAGSKGNVRLQRVCTALQEFLDFSGRWDEKLLLNEQAEVKAETAEDFYKAGWRAYGAGWIYRLRGQAVAVLSCADRCAVHWEKVAQVGARENAIAISLRGSGHELAKAYPAAIAAYQEALALLRTVSPESVDVATGLNNLANVEQEQGEYAAAERHLREALRMARKVDYQQGVAIYTGNLAELALMREAWGEAEALAQEALPLSEKVGRRQIIGSNCWRLAKALARQSKPEAGLPYARRAVAIFTHLRLPDELADAQAVLAECGG